MKRSNTTLLLLLSLSFFLIQCKKDRGSTRLSILVADEAGNKLPNIPVKLYTTASDPGIIQTSDANGIALFSNLQLNIVYSWFAEQGCKNNRRGQGSTGQPLVPNMIIYGSAILTESGTLNIINNSLDTFHVTAPELDYYFNNADHHNIYPLVGAYALHWEDEHTPGIGKDTILQILCNQTVTLNLPY